MTGYNLFDLAVASGSAGGVFGLVFVGVRWTANFIAGRIDKKEAVVGAGMTELLTGLKERIDLLSKSEKELRQELAEDRAEFRAYQRETDAQLSECRRKHAESEAEVMQLRSMLQGYGDARQIAALQAAADKVSERATDKRGKP